MKSIATVALMINFGAACIHAQQIPVNMTFSGTGGASPINLGQPNTSTLEEDVAGTGTLGSFTFRNVRAASLSPQPSSACSAMFFPSVAGGGVLRFKDGSLLTVNLTQGGDCINFVTNTANCTLTLKITGGTGRFKSASGVLTYSETPGIVLFDNNPVLFTETGTLTGTVSGVGVGQQGLDERQ